jgi:hypothetical protein
LAGLLEERDAAVAAIGEAGHGHLLTGRGARLVPDRAAADVFAELVDVDGRIHRLLVGSGEGGDHGLGLDPSLGPDSLRRYRKIGRLTSVFSADDLALIDRLRIVSPNRDLAVLREAVLAMDDVKIPGRGTLHAQPNHEPAVPERSLPTGEPLPDESVYLVPGVRNVVHVRLKGGAGVAVSLRSGVLEPRRVWLGGQWVWRRPPAVEGRWVGPHSLALTVNRGADPAAVRSRVRKILLQEARNGREPVNSLSNYTMKYGVPAAAGVLGAVGMGEFVGADPGALAARVGAGLYLAAFSGALMRRFTLALAARQNEQGRSHLLLGGGAGLSEDELRGGLHEASAAIAARLPAELGVPVEALPDPLAVPELSTAATAHFEQRIARVVAELAEVLRDRTAGTQVGPGVSAEVRKAIAEVSEVSWDGRVLRLTVGGMRVSIDYRVGAGPTSASVLAEGSGQDLRYDAPIAPAGMVPDKAALATLGDAAAADVVLRPLDEALRWAMVERLADVVYQAIWLYQGLPGFGTNLLQQFLWSPPMIAANYGLGALFIDQSTGLVYVAAEVARRLATALVTPSVARRRELAFALWGADTWRKLDYPLYGLGPTAVRLGPTTVLAGQARDQLAAVVEAAWRQAADVARRLAPARPLPADPRLAGPADRVEVAGDAVVDQASTIPGIDVHDDGVDAQGHRRVRLVPAPARLRHGLHRPVEIVISADGPAGRSGPPLAAGRIRFGPVGTDIGQWRLEVADAWTSVAALEETADLVLSRVVQTVRFIRPRHTRYLALSAAGPEIAALGAGLVGPEAALPLQAVGVAGVAVDGASEAHTATKETNRAVSAPLSGNSPENATPEDILWLTADGQRARFAIERNLRELIGQHPDHPRRAELQEILDLIPPGPSPDQIYRELGTMFRQSAGDVADLWRQRRIVQLGVDRFQLEFNRDSSYLRGLMHAQHPQPFVLRIALGEKTAAHPGGPDADIILEVSREDAENGYPEALELLHLFAVIVAGGPNGVPAGTEQIIYSLGKLQGSYLFGRLAAMFTEPDLGVTKVLGELILQALVATGELPGHVLSDSWHGKAWVLATHFAGEHAKSWAQASWPLTRLAYENAGDLARRLWLWRGDPATEEPPATPPLEELVRRTYDILGLPPDPAPPTPPPPPDGGGPPDGGSPPDPGGPPDRGAPPDGSGPPDGDAPPDPDSLPDGAGLAGGGGTAGAAPEPTTLAQIRAALAGTEPAPTASAIAEAAPIAAVDPAGAAADLAGMAGDPLDGLRAGVAGLDWGAGLPADPGRVEELLEFRYAVTDTLPRLADEQAAVRLLLDTLPAGPDQAAARAELRAQQQSLADTGNRLRAAVLAWRWPPDGFPVPPDGWAGLAAWSGVGPLDPPRSADLDPGSDAGRRELLRHQAMLAAARAEPATATVGYLDGYLSRLRSMQELNTTLVTLAGELRGEVAELVAASAPEPAGPAPVAADRPPAGSRAAGPGRAELGWADPGGDVTAALARVAAAAERTVRAARLLYPVRAVTDIPNTGRVGRRPLDGADVPPVGAELRDPGEWDAVDRRLAGMADLARAAQESAAARATGERGSAGPVVWQLREWLPGLLTDAVTGLRRLGGPVQRGKELAGLVTALTDAIDAWDRPKPRAGGSIAAAPRADRAAASLMEHSGRLLRGLDRALEAEVNWHRQEPVRRGVRHVIGVEHDLDAAAAAGRGLAGDPARVTALAVVAHAAEQAAARQLDLRRPPAAADPAAEPTGAEPISAVPEPIDQPRRELRLLAGYLERLAGPRHSPVARWWDPQLPASRGPDSPPER